MTDLNRDWSIVNGEIVKQDRFSGSEPNVGSFDCHIDSTGDEWCIFVMAHDGQRIERYCSTWQNEPCNGLTRVYEILRELGFNVGS